jgi:hypothetical protein
MERKATKPMKKNKKFQGCFSFDESEENKKLLSHLTHVAHDSPSKK